MNKIATDSKELDSILEDKRAQVSLFISLFAAFTDFLLTNSFFFDVGG